MPVRAGYRFVRGHTPLRVPDVKKVGSQLDLSAPIYESSEEGDQSNAIVAVIFSERIQSADLALGVTIKVDGVTATISSALLQGDGITVFYTLTSWAAANSSVTYTYSDIVGDYNDLSGNQLGDVGPITVTNNVGRHLRFDDAPNSMHLAWL